MTVHLSFCLILTGLTGVYCITTVSEVSVKAGDSLTIPCLYESKYTNHVKYLCKGYNWLSCAYVATTNQPQSSGKFLISDDKTQKIFTVTIKDITDEDTDKYWCVVEINAGSDVEQHFHLSVSRGSSLLYVDHQEITAFIGHSITINCYSQTSGEVKWCRLGRSCVTSSSGSIDRTTVTINVSDSNVFTVTMSQLTTESSGWYWCVQGNLQMPVNLTVTDKPNNTPLVTTTATHSTTSTVTESVRLTSVFEDNHLTTAQFDLLIFMVEQQKFIIPVSVGIFIMTVALFVLFRLKRRKKSKSRSAVVAQAEDEVIYCNSEYIQNCQAEQEAIYCNNVPMAKRKKTPPPL